MSAANEVLTRYEKITPSDTIADPSNGAATSVLTNVSGAFSFIDLDGNQHDMTSLSSGIWHPMSVKWVLATSTDATEVWFGR